MFQILMRHGQHQNKIIFTICSVTLKLRFSMARFPILRSILETNTTRCISTSAFEPTDRQAMLQRDGRNQMLTNLLFYCNLNRKLQFDVFMQNKFCTSLSKSAAPLGNGVRGRPYFTSPQQTLKATLLTRRDLGQKEMRRAPHRKSLIFSCFVIFQVIFVFD